MSLRNKTSTTEICNCALKLFKELKITQSFSSLTIFAKLFKNAIKSQKQGQANQVLVLSFWSKVFCAYADFKKKSSNKGSASMNSNKLRDHQRRNSWALRVKKEVAKGKNCPHEIIEHEDYSRRYIQITNRDEENKLSIIFNLL